MVFGFFRSDSSAVRDKIIYTQKQHIVKLEDDLHNLKQQVDDRHNEIRTLREKHDLAKERLIEQIVDLSDKFATNHSKVLQIAEENARLKIMLEMPASKRVITYAPKTTKKYASTRKAINKKIVK